MSTRKLSNISLKDFQKFLVKCGLTKIKSSKGRGGHEKWSRKDLRRPITIQTHVDPVPTFIIQQVLRTLKIDRDEFLNLLKQK